VLVYVYLYSLYTYVYQWFTTAADLSVLVKPRYRLAIRGITINHNDCITANETKKINKDV
jgi:hypothetical protein